MDSRQQFEEWFRSSGYNEGGEDDFLWSDLSEQYTEGWVECSWQSWLASRDSIISENEILRKAAERYWWVREQSRNESGIRIVHPFGKVTGFREMIDSAIDDYAEIAEA